ncbi:Mpo1-like protein [Euhalothece natronophila]|uniref:Mpo1-like protein n=1 Tax=Euhalothece natronophila TaxID=577489 RepID=UPI001FE862C7|nr:Mpo1-like protein [Euhalothece natronophila]
MRLTYFQQAKESFIAGHQHPINQALHHMANLLVFIGIGLLFVDWRLTLICGILTQIFAIGGHILFEKNEPAFKQYPGIVILVSISWSLGNWFGLRQLFQQTKQQSN